jgi:S-DNA-T family DNA segregation ATPase FtsK/SpoIIIE
MTTVIRPPVWRIGWKGFLAIEALKALGRLIRLAYRWPKTSVGLILGIVAVWGVKTLAAMWGWPSLIGLGAVAAGLGLAALQRHMEVSERRGRPQVRSAVRGIVLYRRDWRSAMKFAGLSYKDEGEEYLPTLVSVKTGKAVDRVRLKMLPGQTITDYGKAAERLAQTFDAREVRPKSVHRRHHLLDLLVLREDPLDVPVAPLSPPNVDLERVPVGIREDGKPFSLRLLYSHILVAGLTGSGKGSVIWSLLLGIAPAIREGRVKVFAIDPKGGMELALGEPLFEQFIHGDAEEMADFLDEAVLSMQRRAKVLRGLTRKMVPSAEPGNELIVIIIDEIASLTSYVQDAALRKRIGNALSMLLSQGRAVGVCVIAATQDARKEVLSMRDLFPARVALRTGSGSRT